MDQEQPSAPAPEASEAKAEAPKPRTLSTRIPKLAKKNKSRLPRRQKKALQKAADAKRAGETKIWLWRPADSNAFEMRGTLASSASEPESVTIVEPVLWTGHVVRDTLVASGIPSSGNVRCPWA